MELSGWALDFAYLGAVIFGPILFYLAAAFLAVSFLYALVMASIFMVRNV